MTIETSVLLFEEAIAFFKLESFDDADELQKVLTEFISEMNS